MSIISIALFIFEPTCILVWFSYWISYALLQLLHYPTIEDEFNTTLPEPQVVNQLSDPSSMFSDRCAQSSKSKAVSWSKVFKEPWFMCPSNLSTNIYIMEYQNIPIFLFVYLSFTVKEQIFSYKRTQIEYHHALTQTERSAAGGGRPATTEANRTTRGCQTNPRTEKDIQTRENVSCQTR